MAGRAESCVWASLGEPGGGGGDRGGRGGRIGDQRGSRILRALLK